MSRRLLNLVTLLSLLLCVAAVALWVRSYVVSDRLLRSAFEEDGGITYWTQDCLAAGRGGVAAGRIVQSFPGDAEFVRRRFERRPPDFYSPIPPVHPGITAGRVPGWSALGFRFARYESPVPGQRPSKALFEIVVPLWVLLLATAILPARCGWIWFRRPRARGLCRSCGYDLRATPDRCPECGAVP